MRDHSGHIELTREEAVRKSLEASGFTAEDRRPPIDLVPLAESFGRVLAEDVVALSPVPSALTCNMDSIAVHWADFENGMPDTSSWVRGVDWEFANTGVAMPAGFDTAIVVEHVRVSEDEQHVAIDAAPSARGAGTHPAGSRLQVGDLLEHAGTVITPDVAAHIASGNHATAAVARKPRVAFIPTGNELVPAGAPALEPASGKFAETGKNFETNSLLVRGKVEQWGGVYVPFDIVPDVRSKIRAAIERAARISDIVVVNAGSSKGSDDWTCEVLEELGEVICHETNHGPGHHSSFAVVDGTVVVGISGPSGGASPTLDFYLRPLMRAYLGLDPILSKTPAILTDDLPAKKSPGAAGKAKAAGEQRPSKARPKGFFAIRMMKVEAGADGMLHATPLPGRPGSKEAAAANAYTLVPTDDVGRTPHAGDVIAIEYR
ncbi:molybdopterin-binding protein [Curtanaerobium respiraculi]|uniref:molybdopterin-binding protein n=1 Tax=Curtanaerobium respiraculi TaxID=2949669 RepID=UPI0024B341AE|nr:molybdopterin-binding protein [Curtanaerobium respiraculi]